MPYVGKAKNPRPNTNEVSKRLLLEDLDEKRKSKSVNFVFHDPQAPQPPSTTSAVAAGATVPVTPQKFKGRSAEASQILKRRTSPRLQSKYSSQPRPNYRIESGSEFEHSEYEDLEDIDRDEEDEDAHSNTPNFEAEEDQGSDSETTSCEDSSLSSEESVVDGNDSEESQVDGSGDDSEESEVMYRAPGNFQIKSGTALGDKPDKGNLKGKREPIQINPNSGPRTSHGVELQGDENRSQPVINKPRAKMSMMQHPNSKKGKERRDDIQFQVLIPAKPQKLQQSFHQSSSSSIRWRRREYQETQEDSGEGLPQKPPRSAPIRNIQEKTVSRPSPPKSKSLTPIGSQDNPGSEVEILGEILNPSQDDHIEPSQDTQRSVSIGPMPGKFPVSPPPARRRVPGQSLSDPVLPSSRATDNQRAANVEMGVMEERGVANRLPSTSDSFPRNQSRTVGSRGFLDLSKIAKKIVDQHRQVPYAVYIAISRERDEDTNLYRVKVGQTKLLEGRDKRHGDCGLYIKESERMVNSAKVEKLVQAVLKRESRLPGSSYSCITSYGKIHCICGRTHSEVFYMPDDDVSWLLDLIFYMRELDFQDTEKLIKLEREKMQDELNKQNPIWNWKFIGSLLRR